MKSQGSRRRRMMSLRDSEEEEEAMFFLSFLFLFGRLKSEEPSNIERGAAHAMKEGEM
jgi:hypothetical protein